MKELRVDGGAANNKLLMQFQANINEVPVLRPKNTETTALGAGLLAGLGAGFWKSLEDLPSQETGGTEFKPEKDFAFRDQVVADWKRAVKTAEFWASEL